MARIIVVLFLASMVYGLPKAFGEGEQLLARIPPKTNVKQAIQIAEKYVGEQKLDVSQRFISSVRYIEVGNWTESFIGKGPYWQVTWELVKRGDGGQYFVLVYMDGKAGHLGGL